MVKSKLPPHSGSAALRKLNSIHKKGAQNCFLTISEAVMKSQCRST